MVASGEEGTSNITIPFEDATGGDPQIEAVIQQSAERLNQLMAFKGCGEFIREAITSPSPQTEEAAWSAVVPSVETLKTFYDFSNEVEKSAKKLLQQLCPGNPQETLTNQANFPLARQLACLLDFVVRFDDSKMSNPAIQNDFSYYRRMLNRMKLSNKKDKGVIVTDEEANGMSLFFAYPTPMMNTLIKATNSLSDVPMETVCKFLAAFANSCYSMVKQAKLSSATSNMLALRSVAGSIILYDHINPKGVFHKKTPVHVKNAITVIKGFKDESTESLISAIKFNTVHLSEPETQPQVKALLG